MSRSTLIRNRDSVRNISDLVDAFEHHDDMSVMVMSNELMAMLGTFTSNYVQRCSMQLLDVIDDRHIYGNMKSFETSYVYGYHRSPPDGETPVLFVTYKDAADATRCYTDLPRLMIKGVTDKDCKSFDMVFEAPKGLLTW